MTFFQLGFMVDIIIMNDYILLQCEAPKIAKLVPITPITMAYGTYNYSYWGESKPTYNWGGHIVSFPAN